MGPGIDTLISVAARLFLDRSSTGGLIECVVGGALARGVSVGSGKRSS